MNSFQRGEQTKKAVCAFCPANCVVLTHIKDGKVTRVEGNPEHPLTHGHVCKRAGYAPRWPYHSDQVTYPLKRVGNQGEGYPERNLS